MTRDRHSPSIVPLEEPESEEEEEEEKEEEEEVEEEQVDADAENRNEEEADEESEAKEDSPEKTTSQVRGLDYGSDGDSGRTFPSPAASAFVVKQISKPKKRPAESDPPKEMREVKTAKKNKKGNVAVAEVNLASEDKSKRSSGGIGFWGPEDELVILTGMLDYKEKTGVDYNSNFDTFYEYIKGSLNAGVDKSQLINKIKSLRGMYRSNAQREANGEAIVFLEEHEEKVYEHSKKLWEGKAVRQGFQLVSNAPTLSVPEIEASKKEVIGVSVNAASCARKVTKMNIDEVDVEKKGSTIPKPAIIPMSAMCDNTVIEKGLELVERSKVDALNEQWTKYQIDAADLYLRKLDLVMEHIRLFLDALKSIP